MSEKDTPRVIIQVMSGIVHLKEKTKGVEVIIRDYDLLGCQPHEHTTGKNGEKYIETVYQAQIG